MRSPEAIGINQAQYLGKFRVTVEAIKPEKKTIPGSVAVHEATHAVAAVVNGTAVKSATIIPDSDSLGKTILSRPDAIAAAAPHATGCSGTGHDMAIVRFMGRDESATASAGRSIIESNHDKVHAVATILEERGSVTGYEIDEAMRADNKKIEVKVSVEDLEKGKATTKQAIANNGFVGFDSRWGKPTEKELYELTA